MDYKSFLISNYDKLCKIRIFIEQMDDTYFTVEKTNEQQMNNDTISIVMTASNRSIQTYFTIETISKSSHKNVQVIIVDDSTNDPILIDQLHKYNVHIELIKIRNKFWINPCVNYNIGFRHARGGKIIIQNAEVCHVGDVIEYVAKNIVDDQYHIFNVCNMGDMYSNYKLYDIEDMSRKNQKKIIRMKSGGIDGWYQHRIIHNSKFHFLTSLTKSTFDKIGGFDIDYALGIDYDDADLLFKIEIQNINIINVPDYLMGVHQWHTQSSAGSHTKNVNNDHIYHCKQKYYQSNKKNLILTDHEKPDAINIINKWF